MLNKKQFRNPPSHCYPGYFWGINAEMIPEELICQLRDMYRHGARSVCLHPVPKEFRPDISSSMSPAYLSEEYHQVIKQVVDECRKLGMNYYLYDEGGWPSGSACGQVFASDPERFAQRFIVEDKSSDRGWKIFSPPYNPANGAMLPGIAEKGAAEKFLELTHDAYAEHIGGEFGKSIRIAFMDEPYMPSPSPLREWANGPAMLGWCADFAEEFKKRKNYDIVPHLTTLMARRSNVADKLAYIRLDYMDVLSKLFVERFMLPIRDWCRKHGIKSGGHFGGEDEWLNFHCTGFGHIMRSMRALDVPGVDMIWRQLYPGSRLHPFPKLASSAAHQTGGREVLGELFAVYSSGLTPQVMKYLLDYMFVCGVNTFIFSNISQSLKGKHMPGCRPHFGRPDPLWKHFGHLHEYAARTGALLKSGTVECDTALYFDVRAMWLGARPAEYAINRTLEISQKLLESQRDFDYVDDDLIEEAVIGRKHFKFGNKSYRNLVVPFGSMMTDAAKKRLDEFRNAGIRVLTPDEIDIIEPVIKLKNATGKLRVSKIRFGREQYGYFVFNTSSVPVSASFELPDDAGEIALADAQSGKFFRVSDIPQWDWEFQPWESRFFISGCRGDFELPQPGKIIAEIRKFQAVPQLQHIVDTVQEIYRIAENDAPEMTVQPGDWRKYFGEYFSGTVLYTAEFTCKTPERAAFLDLGRVNYACEVKLNGKSLGGSMFPPFVFDISQAVKPGRNHLEITVSNTLSNALASPEVSQAWEKYRPLAYEDIQRTFESEALPSGLFGPVVVRERIGK